MIFINKNNLFVFFVFTLSFLLSSCAVQTDVNVFSQPKGSKPLGCPLEIYRNSNQITKEYEIIASINLEDSGFSVACGRGKAMTIIRDEACAVGGDAVLITNERGPDIFSSCYRANATILSYKEVTK